MALIGASNSLGGLAGSNSIARLLVVISGDATGLSAAVAQAEGSLAGIGNNASSIGKTLTRGLTLPLLALGGLATKMAIDFESALARVAALTPLTDELGGGIDAVREKILSIANDPQIIAGPTDLANALYFAGSAGLSAENAFQVTELAAKGMSVGMGDASDIAKVLIFALNNYPDTALTAASAMDALTVAIRDGTAEPNELAIALGRLLPVAAEAGISFEQVTASVSQLSNLGVPVRVATTSLRALFSQLLSPTIEATQLLAELGITAEQLRSQLELGPVAAFQLLLKATHGNIDALHDIIPQIRGFTAFLGLTGDKAKKLAEIFKDMQNDTGAFQRVLDQISKTPGFKFQKSVQELQVAGIALGEQLIPVFLRIVSVIDDLASGFSKLPTPVLAAFAAFITLGAAAGPVLQLYGALTQVETIALGSAGLTAIVPTVKAIALGFVTAGIAAGFAASGLASMASGSLNLVSVGTALIGTFIAARTAIFGVQQVLSRLASEKLATGILSGFLGLSGGQITAIAIAIAAIGAAMAYMISQSHAVDRAAADLGETLLNSAKTGDIFSEALKKIGDSETRAQLEAIAKEMKLLDLPTGQALAGLQEGLGGDLISQLHELTAAAQAADPEIGGGLVDSLIKFDNAAKAAEASGAGYNEVIDQAGLTTGEFGTLLDQLDPGGDTPFAQMAQGVDGLSAKFQAARGVLIDYQDSQAAAILGTEANTAAIEDFAKANGVSTDFVKGKLNELGTSLVGANGETLQSFKEFAFGVDKNNQVIGGAAAEAAAAVDQQVTDMANSLREGFTVFGELPEKFKGTVDKMVSNAQELGRVALETSQNIVSLQKQGVPQGLIDQLIGEGPAALDKFASATPGQMQKIIDAYSVGLAAMDEEILKEGAHQEVKGKNMVANFATAILGSSHLTQGAAKELINFTVGEFEKGHLGAKQLGIVADFTRGIGHVKGISQREAHAAVLSFVKGLAAGKGAQAGGHKLVEQLAQGIAKAKGITIQQARALVNSVKSQIAAHAPEVNNAGNRLGAEIGRGVKKGTESQSGAVNNAGNKLAVEVNKGLATADDQAFSRGAQVGSQFAAGINSQASAAAAAARNLANAAKQAMDTGLKNSPEYFTYYMGKKLVTDMARGVRDQSKTMPTHKPTFVGGIRGGDRDMARLGEILGKGGGNVEVHVHGNVYADDFDARVVSAVNRAERPRARGHHK